jgi:branched-chain amino acid transport system permease protein
MGNVYGVLAGGLIINLYDRVFLNQIAPRLIPNFADELQGWRWVMFGVGLMVIMLIRPEGLFPSKVRKAELHEFEIDEAEADMVGGSD